MVQLVPFVSVWLLGTQLSPFVVQAAPRNAGGYQGAQRFTSQCTYAETARVQVAARALGACMDERIDDVKEALFLQAKHGNVLGGIDVGQITACWEAQEYENIALSPACAEELARFDEKASSHDGSPGAKIASKLRDHPEELCACIESIDSAGVECKGWGVMPAVQNLTASCALLRSQGFHTKLPTQSKVSPVDGGNPGDQPQPQPQQEVKQQQQQQGPQEQGQPAHQPQPQQQYQQQQQQPPLPPAAATNAPPAPSLPAAQSPPLLDSYFGRGEGILGGGSRTPYHPDEGTQRIMYCFETAVHFCPQARGAMNPLAFQHCAERAIRQGKLGSECMVILQEVSLDSLALQEIQGFVGRHDVPLNADQLQCVEEVSVECADAKNSGQLHVCVNKGVRKQRLRPACLSYLYE